LSCRVPMMPSPKMSSLAAMETIREEEKLSAVATPPRSPPAQDTVTLQEADPQDSLPSPMHSDMSASGPLRSLFRRNLTRPLVDWSVSEVASWAALTPLPLEVANLLKDNAICGQVLETLTDEDMQVIGINKFGWRRQLMILLKELQQQLQQQDGVNEEQESEMLHERLTDSHAAKRRSSSCEPVQRQAVQERLPLLIFPADKDDEQSAAPTLQGQSVAVNEEKALESHSCGRVAASSFLVDNSQLQSGLSGLGYHDSPALSDSTGVFAPWGTVVHGTPCGKDWVKVGTRFLPTRLNGVAVLRYVLHHPQNSRYSTSQPFSLPAGLLPTRLPVQTNTPRYSVRIIPSRNASHSPARPRLKVLAGGYEATQKMPGKAQIVAAVLRSPAVAFRDTTLK